jgi:DNA ligase 1
MTNNVYFFQCLTHLSSPPPPHSKTAIIKQKYESEGDLGTVAKASKAKQRTLSFGVKPKPLLAKDVLAVFRDISKTTGAQSQKLKVDQIKKLLVRAQGPEAKYIIRGLQGKLRIGLARSTVLISLAHAFCATPPKGVQEYSDDDRTTNDETTHVPEEVQRYRNSKSSKTDRMEAAVAIIKKAYSEVPSYDALLDSLLKVPLDQLHTACTLTPGIPVEPMLAKPTKSIQEVLKRLNGQRFTCEYKYDGERAQVHMLEGGSTFKVFSRNLLDTSEKYPEVPQYVKAAAKDGVTSFVLDTEVVAFNRETGNLVPFQILSTRKKTEESAETAKVQVIVQAFDLMYLNGKSLLNLTLSERRDVLKANFGPVESKFQFATSLDHKEDGDTTVLEDFLDAAVKGQCEGLMVKTLDGNAAYEPSKRSLNWLKLKKDYLEGLGDSVDLVPLGGYYGRGKRTGTFGAYLLACYDPETEEFQSVCKIGTGFSDEDLKTLSESFKDHGVDEKPANYITSDTLACDVWFDAVQVWEVKAADLSKSSTHKGAIGRLGEAGRGIGLRFPRFERLRDDKKPEQATSSEQILEMYYQQDSVVHEGGGDANDDDEGI